MSSQRNRPNQSSGNKAKPTSSSKRPMSQPLAAKTSVPTSKTPSTPLGAAPRAKLGATTASAASGAGRPVARPPAAATKSAAKPAYAPARAAVGTNEGTAARVVRAFTSGFPFAGLEYVIFLGVVETNVRLALPVGLILLGLACGVFFLRQQTSMQPERGESRILTTVRQWLGDPLAVAGSLLLLGAGLLAFTRWNATKAYGFSVLASIALVAAMLLLFVASYRRDVQPA